MNPMLPKSLDPPDGGLDGLRGKLDARRRRRNLYTGMAVTVLALGWFGRGSQLTPDPQGPADLNHPIQRLAGTPPAQPVRIENGVAIEWASSSPTTRIYLVDSDEFPLPQAGEG